MTTRPSTSLRCAVCDGYGRLADAICEDCDGTGWAPPTNSHLLEDLTMASKPTPHVGQTVLYTEVVPGGVKVRAAVVVFLLVDPENPTDIRPVLRVMVPMSPTLGGMPKVPATCAAGMKDYEVYGPKLGTPGEKMTWHPVPAAISAPAAG